MKNDKRITILISGVLGSIASCGFFINYYLNLGSSIIVNGFAVIAFSIILMIRMMTKRRGMLIASGCFYTINVLAGNFLLSDVGTSFFVQMQFLTGIFLMILMLEGVLCISNPPRLNIKTFSFVQIMVAFVAAAFNFFTLKMCSFMENNMIGVGIIIFSITLTTLFAMNLIDQVLGLSLIVSIFTALTLMLGKHTLYFDFFQKQSALEIIIINLAVIMSTECIIAVMSIKNIGFLFRTVRYGHINSSYTKRIKGVSLALIVAMVVPLGMNLAVNDNFEAGLLFRSLVASLITLFGGCMAMALSSNVQEKGLYCKIHGSYQQQWFREFDKWLTCCAIADIDGDGKNELIAGCADKYVYCFKDDKVLWKVNVNNTPSPTCGIGTLGKEEDIKIVVGSYDGKIRCLNSQGEILWENQTASWIWSVAVGDVDNDGENEVVYGGMDNLIHVCKDGGAEIWSSEFDNWIGCCAIGDVDNDGKNEVIAGSSDNTLRCYKNGPNEVWRAHFGEWVNACAIGDVDGDGLNEVVAGGFDGTLRCYRNKEEIWRISIFGSIGALAIGDIDGDGCNEILVGCGDHTIRVLKDGHQVWMARVEKYADGAAIGDIDNDGQLEFVTGDWFCYLRCFKYAKK